MYEDFYGLRERAFALTPNPAFLLLAGRHRETLSLLEYALGGRAGLVVLLGEAGSGKSMVLRAAVEPKKPRDRLVVLDNPLLSRDEFFECVAEGFGLGKEARGSKARFLSRLKVMLGDRQKRGGRIALVVDEAHTLSDELLEEIRLLANLESRSGKRLTIVLVGQPELAERLNDPAMAPIKQRVELRAVLEPLTLAETADYITGRLRVAGGDISPTFTRSAVQAAFIGSEGIPRTISVICESALVTGFAAGARPIDRDIVIEVCRDLDV